MAGMTTFPVTLGFDLSSFDSDGSLAIASTPSNGAFSDVPLSSSSSVSDTDVDSITLVGSEDDDITVYSQSDSGATFYLEETIHLEHTSEAVYFNATSTRDPYTRNFYLSDPDQSSLPMADQIDILESIIRADSFPPPMPHYRMPPTDSDQSIEVALEAGVEDHRRDDDRTPWRGRRFKRTHRSLYSRHDVRSLDIEDHFEPTQYPRIDGPFPQHSGSDYVDDGYFADDEDHSPPDTITEEERTRIGLALLALGVEHISRSMRPAMLAESGEMYVQKPAAAPTAESASGLTVPPHSSLAGRSTSFESIDLNDEHPEEEDFVVVVYDSPTQEMRT